ncbi:glutaredoxin [Candidatus Peregrinibacteria bacterium]|nr:glutaredoxin [Candidatus Peregrinibacteria bacterium]
MKFFSFSSKREILFYIFAGIFLLGTIGSYIYQSFSPALEDVQNDTAVISMFSREKCGHCRDEKKFLAEWKKENPNFSIQILDIEKSKEAGKMFLELTKKYNLSKSTPITIVGDEIFVGFDSAENMGAKIKKAYNSKSSLLTFREAWAQKDNLRVYDYEASVCDANSTECAATSLIVNVPLWGPLDLAELKSPSALSFILGLIDGFNPCAMWVLIVFLLALIQIGDRFKMFVVAGIFLLAEAIMYAMILTLWFSTWNFVGLDAWITPIVGFVALGSGFFFLYEGTFSDGTCKVTSSEQKKKITNKIQAIAHSPLTIVTFFGILALAFSVNIIEFACSIGIPQTFTQILHLSVLPILEKIWYIVIYIFAYMFDDFIVFGIALYSIEKIGITHKYARASNIIGGILMLILGTLLIFAPEVLTFS